MRKTLTLLLLSATLTTVAQERIVFNPDKDVKTTFQTGGLWSPEVDIRADAVMIYGAEDRGSLTFENLVKPWRDHGYTIHFMSGIAWGGRYLEFFNRSYDGKDHYDLAQINQYGDTLWHGSPGGVPYLVPGQEFIDFLKERHIKRAIDAGIDHIFMEEPEFFAYTGYSESFKREWQRYYGFPWRPQHLSAENTYLSNKLKYHLYYRALDDVFTFAKQYGKSKGMDVKCYVPTHSLLNYTNWQVVSPEASLASMKSCDGYIAQVWTGTSRTKNFFNGVLRERIFENAFLEYGCMASMTAPTGRRVYFLTDPIEDNEHDWSDYKHGYEGTFTAQLLYPQHNHYEVMPWPDRIYTKPYNTSMTDHTPTLIPRFYSTQMQVMINALQQMPLSDNKVSGSHGINVVMANSLMFQRRTVKGGDVFKDPVGSSPDDPALSNFYGMVMPLLMRGVPVGVTHMENMGYPKAWDGVKVLMMTYSNMKPLDPEAHKHIADWVRQGGHLVYCSRDTDAYQTVQEWWNQGDMHYRKPAEHMFQLMDMALDPATGTYHFGKGTVTVLRQDPREFNMQANSDGPLLKAVEQAYGPIEYKNNFTLRRGPYLIASVVCDSIISDRPLTLKGKFIDLYDPTLPFVKEKVLHAGEQALLYDLDQVKDTSRPQVIAAASRQYDEKVAKGSFSFVSKSPKNTIDRMVVLLPSKAKNARATVTDAQGRTVKAQMNFIENTSASKRRLYWANLEFENDPDGVHVTINYKQ